MGKRIALVIGTCTYEDPQFAALAAPVHDVRGLAATLRDPKVGGFDEVHELVDRTSRDLQLEISNVFSDREKDDLVVVYISGHGYKDRGKLYFVCKDTRRNRLNATGVPSDYLKQEMEASNARRQVLILDCCHSGAFSAGMKSGAGVGDKAGAIDELGGDESGKIVLTASDAIQYAYEGDAISGQAQNSVFTKHLLEGLRTGAADMDGDGSISVDELFDYVRQKVREERPEQRPQRSATAESGEVYIARSPYVKPAALNADLVEATRSKDRLVVMGSIDELWRMLEDPDPRIAAAARQRLQEMLVEDHFRSVHDKVQEALDAVPLNVVVKPRAVKVRTGPAGAGSAGVEPAEPTSAPSGPWLRQGTGPGLVDVVIVRAGERRPELARAIGAATGAGQRDAEAFIHDAPHALFPRLNQADARRLVEELERCGATVEVRPIRSRSASESDSSVWAIPRTSPQAGPPHTTAPAEVPRRPVRVAAGAGARLGRHDAGLGTAWVAMAVTGAGLAFWAIVSAAVLQSAGEYMTGRTEAAMEMGFDTFQGQEAMRAGMQAFNQAMVVAWMLWVGIGAVTMSIGLPVGWNATAWLKRVAVGAAWAVFPPAGAGVSGWVSRDQPGMTAGRAWMIVGAYCAGLAMFLFVLVMYDTAVNESVSLWPFVGIAAGVLGAGGAFAQWAILAGARRGARHSGPTHG